MSPLDRWHLVLWVNGSHLCRPGDPKPLLPGEEQSTSGKACFAVRSGAGCHATQGVPGCRPAPSRPWAHSSSLSQLFFRGLQQHLPTPGSFCRPRELGPETLGLGAARGLNCRGYSLHHQAHWTSSAERLLQASGTEIYRNLCPWRQLTCN